jgi:hypothetical protein
LKNIEDELNKLEEVWMCVKDWEEFWMEYATALFQNINIDELEGTSMELFGLILYFLIYYLSLS